MLRVAEGTSTFMTPPPSQIQGFCRENGFVVMAYLLPFSTPLSSDNSTIALSDALSLRFLGLSRVLSEVKFLSLCEQRKVCWMQTREGKLIVHTDHALISCIENADYALASGLETGGARTDPTAGSSNDNN